MSSATAVYPYWGTASDTLELPSFLRGPVAATVELPAPVPAPQPTPVPRPEQQPRRLPKRLRRAARSFATIDVPAAFHGSAMTAAALVAALLGYAGSGFLG